MAVYLMHPSHQIMPFAIDLHPLYFESLRALTWLPRTINLSQLGRYLYFINQLFVEMLWLFHVFE